jgi:hypothetical protein
MHEIIVNLHMHTCYSDGGGSHEDLIQAAFQAGIDAIIVTDHNVWVNGIEKVYRDGDRRLLLLMGEEVHDRELVPQGNHLLILGAGQEMSLFARDPQHLIDQARRAGGLTFLAHPFESSAPAIGEPPLSWMNWEVHSFTGIELWNEMSELKSRLATKLHAVFYVFFPAMMARGPSAETVAKWDELLAQGKRIVAIGGTDAHAFQIKAGPFRKTVFPYEFHFRALNTHILSSEPLRGETEDDRKVILDGLRSGRCFIGYDLAAPTSGFRFSAHGGGGRAWIGEELSARDGVTFQIKLPRSADCRLLRDGQTVRAWRGTDTCTYITNETGTYRVEVDIRHRGLMRAWIRTNPIFVTG